MMITSCASSRQFYKDTKKSDIGSYDDYLNITALFKDKLGMDVNVRIDEDKEMVIFSIK